MANELLSDEKIQEAADKYAPVFEIDGKQLSKVEILQRQHARLRSIAMAQVDHLKARGYVLFDRERMLQVCCDNCLPNTPCPGTDPEECEWQAKIVDQLKEILTGGKDGH